MELSHRVEILLKEHKTLLLLADRIEKSLESASKKDFKAHLRGLAGLRSLEHGLAQVVRHCQVQDSIVNLMSEHYTQPEERARIGAEHEQILRLVSDFIEELKFATPDRTMAMILPGMDVVKWLRAHIAYEQELLNRIARFRELPTKCEGSKKTSKSVRQKAKRHIAKRKPQTKRIHLLPYTLEPHPEL